MQAWATTSAIIMNQNWDIVTDALHIMLSKETLAKDNVTSIVRVDKTFDDLDNLQNKVRHVQ